MRLLIAFCVIFLSVQADEYLDERLALIEEEESDEIGSNITLTDNEQKLNAILMAAKIEVMNASFQNPSQFLPSKHFFLAKRAIEESKLYSIIKLMPKGGALHVHDVAWCSIDFVIKNITYREYLYVCIENNTYTTFKFADPAPNGSCWVSLGALRANATDMEQFDANLYKVLSLVTPNPAQAYPDLNTVWSVFQTTFDVVKSIIQFWDVFPVYYYQALQEFYDDNVNYVELRTSIPDLYCLNGSIVDPLVVFQMLIDVTDKFKEDHDDFIGVKFIYAKNRVTTVQKTATNIETAKTLVQMFPTNIIGFDLVGQEDIGLTLYQVIDQLRNASSEIKFFFHAGETLWNGMSTDENLIDAVLLHSIRIGHAYALTKHPEVMRRVKELDIAVELNPISNQVLELVNDLRNHPASYLLANNFSVVISCDDPSMWNATGLSDDFYETFIGIANCNADLRMLKQLALNSIQYSGLNETEKLNATCKWAELWERFVNNSLTLFGNGTEY